MSLVASAAAPMGGREGGREGGRVNDPFHDLKKSEEKKLKGGREGGREGGKAYQREWRLARPHRKRRLRRD